MPFILFLFAAVAGFRQAAPGYHYQFPRDHFDHPEFRTEWWYYTGNVHARDGHRYGFELVFFRRAEHRGPAANPSAWRIDDLYLAHLALTDIDARRFRYTQSRGPRHRRHQRPRRPHLERQLGSPLGPVVQRPDALRRRRRDPPQPSPGAAQTCRDPR